MTPADRAAIVERLTASEGMEAQAINLGDFDGSDKKWALYRLAQTRRLIELVRALDVEE